MGTFATPSCDAYVATPTLLEVMTMEHVHEVAMTGKVARLLRLIAEETGEGEEAVLARVLGVEYRCMLIDKAVAGGTRPRAFGR
jgi:hypothetical protein